MKSFKTELEEMNCELQYFVDEKLKIGERISMNKLQRLNKMFNLPRSPTRIGEQKMTPVMPSEQNGQMAREQIDQ